MAGNWYPRRDRNVRKASSLDKVAVDASDAVSPPSRRSPNPTDP